VEKKIIFKHYNLGRRCSIIITCVIVPSPMYRSTSVLAPSEGLAMVWFPGSTLWGSSSWWWNTYIVSSVSKNFTFYARVDIEKHISEVARISKS